MVRVLRTGRVLPAREFDVQAMLEGTMGGVFSGVPVRVRLRFRGKAARLVRERVWHESQELEVDADGRVVMTLQAAHTPELERWVLSWGAKVQVLEPEGLREAVRREAEAVLAEGGDAMPRG